MTPPLRITLLAGLLLSATAHAAPNVVISQVYGGGGNSGATYRNDFIELFNRGDADADLGGWSVQYASATGSSWAVTPLPAVTLAPGHYLLVQESRGSGGTTDLPAPDVPGGTLTLSATAGKVVLLKSTAKLADARPASADIVDAVGFGAANFFEGSGPTDAASNTMAVLRGDAGCSDTGDNHADFAVASPSPRNGAAPAHVCGGAAPAIVLACPASLAAQAGTASTAILKASATGSVNRAAISAGGVAGIALDGFVPGAAASVNLTVAPIVPAGTYPVIVTFADDASGSASCTVNVAVAAGELAIPAIQGSGRTSPYAGTVQTTSGVVTKKVSSGFFLQDPAGDGDPTTSDAIFVFTNNASVNVGDLVRVTGTVTEYTPNGAPRSVTEIAGVGAVAVLGSGYTIAPTNITLPAADLGRYEGMLVRFAQPLIVNGNAYLGERGELVLGSTRHETPTNAYRPGTQAARDLAAAQAQDVVLLDDGIFTVPATVPYLADDGTVRSGDTVTNLVGVLDFGAKGGGGGWYKVQPTAAPQFSRTNPRVQAPQVAAGNVKVASANVLNFFTTFTNGDDAFGGHGQGCALGASVAASNCRGADSLAEFTRQRDKIVGELVALDADVVGLMEIQNNGDTAVSYLVAQLNAALGGPVYAIVPQPADTGTDAIRVAMVYKQARLERVGAALSDSDTVHNRPPLAQTFKLKADGARFSVIVNHLKSKSGCGGATGTDADSGDGQGCWNGTRVRQATRLLQGFLPQVVASAGDPDVLLVGDFNAYGHEDPIATLTAGALVNELERFVRAGGDTPYSFVFDGERGYLDHALATGALDAQVAGVVEWHNNADEPDAIDYNLGDNAVDPYVNNPFRASDHDPVLVSLNLASAFTDVSASVRVVQSGLTYNRFTARYTGTVTLTNTGVQALQGPLQLVLRGLPAGVTLANAAGSQAGAPYVTLAGTSLAAGASVSVTTTFDNPGKVAIGYTPVLYSGTF